MTHTLRYNSVPVTYSLSPSHLCKNAFITPKVLSFYRFTKRQSIRIRWSGFNTNAHNITGSSRAPRCNVSIGKVENVADGSMGLQTRPPPAETCRTLMELSLEGTLCTLTQDGWPFGDAVEFAVDAQGMPVLCLDPLSMHSQHVSLNKLCSLHVKLELPGCRNSQCTLMGTLSKSEDRILKQRLQSIWARRFGEVNEDHLYVIAVEKMLQSQGLGKEGFWVDAVEYSRASADPLRDRVAKIVKDMNDNQWEDIRRICNVYADLDVEVEEVSMTWIDRLGFDLHLLTLPKKEILEVRIPFPREVTDERDARSSLTYLAQVAWEVEKNYAPPEFERVKCVQK